MTALMWAMEMRASKEVVELLVSKGAVEWRPTNKVYRRRLRWSRFDQVMREAGRRV